MVKASNIKSVPLALRQKLREPSAWSVLLSFGLHGIFLILLPILPFAAREASEPEIRQPVALLELTPEEQSRLPDFSTASPPQLPSVQPNDPFSFSPFPSPAPLAPPQGLPPLNFPPAPPLLLYPFPSPPQAVTPSPRPTPSVAPSPPPATPGQSPSPRPDASPTPSPERIGSVTDIAPPVDANPNAPSDVPNAESTLPETDTPASTPSPTPDQRQALLQEQQQLRALYSFNDEGTDTAATPVREKITGWYQEAAQWIGDEQTLDTQPIEAIAGSYPVPACLRRLSATALVGVMVNADGEVVDEPEPTVLVSSGYGIFNQLALETLSDYKFEATGNRAAYLVPVQFEPTAEICPPGTARAPAQNS
ncbi:energy transducer TonB [Oculatella sp. LEGE 06141]|uniref:energy transducer TonB n=1 Tax=Oculatella sp. LEGE 06141 TaxID=1828648 RepID=UPI00187F7A2D|nr:energy transducer TonB [Oculatella sp. LEGE 06141]MBE9181302.1 energy transducer TonB [Oculatella sp. LEGE 06141]